MQIRYLAPGDAVSRIYEESWKYAYKGIVPQDYLDALQTGDWALNLEHPDLRTLVCDADGVLVGACSFGPSRLPQFPRWGEIVSLYLLPAYMGKGCGKMLLESAIAELKRQGYKDVLLWVLEKNDRAKAFYRRSGFSPTDDHLETTIGGKRLQEVRYVYNIQ